MFSTYETILSKLCGIFSCDVLCKKTVYNYVAMYGIVVFLSINFILFLKTMKTEHFIIETKLCRK